eukprot:TRINITY_DN122_c0_g1_i1.p2 TRINITY_DN122_c0_g1~~TRINITY_DN122_c0_g1_i1.p2  ORF type:complete len:53 (+),score=4.15 TRINITY_DN122_c0_g1_i1:126-284(+)
MQRTTLCLCISQEISTGINITSQQHKAECKYALEAVSEDFLLEESAFSYACK